MESKINSILFSLFVLVFITGCGSKWSEETKNGYNLVHNSGGQTLGYSPESGVTLIEKSGFAFKDLNQNGELDVYEDWRKPVDERATTTTCKW